MSEWQPIETAPKDGACVLVAHGQLMAVAFADPENEFAWTLDDGHDYRPCLRRELSEPTHWMPLPSAPLSTTNKTTWVNVAENTGALDCGAPANPKWGPRPPNPL